MKNTKKIGVLISLLLIALVAVSAVSAAEDATLTDDADIAAVEEVTVDDTQITDDTSSESDDEIIDDSDSADLEDQIDDSLYPKDVLQAEPLRAEGDGNFSALNALINGASAGSTITLDRNYVFNPSTDLNVVRTGSGSWTNPYRYYGLTISKNIIIDGAGYSIDGANQMRAFYINGATVTLKNINFINCNASSSNYACDDQYGGAIYCYGRPTVKIQNCTFNNNYATYGGAMYIASGTTNITGSNFTNNRAYDGGAFYGAGGYLNVRTSEIINNRASHYGGAIYQNANPTVTIKGCAIFNNSATINGGNNSYLANGAENKYDYSENWWGTNKGAAYTVYSQRVEAYFANYDYFVVSEILTSPIEITVNMSLDSNSTPTVNLDPRHASIVTDVALISIEEGWVPEAFVIDFTTSEDAYINVTVDNQLLVLKVFAGENKKNITQLDLEIEDVTLPDKPILFVTSDVDGIYNITLGDNIYEVEVVDGKGNYTFEGLGVGEYTIIVSRVDDPVYKTIFRTAEFEVKRYVNELTISTETPNPTYGTDVTITHTFNPEGPTGTITYFVDGSEVGTELEVGQDFVLSGLNAGEHTIVAKYGGDGKYGASESNVLTINVAKATLDITVEDVTVSYPNKGTVNVNANRDGKYNISVNNKDYEVIIVDGTGSFEVTEVLAVGTYDIAWNIEESENYTATNGYALYNVEKTAPEFSIDGDMEVFYGDINTITPYLNDDAEGTISYSINGSAPVELGVDEKFDTAVLDVGTYKVVAKYSGDNNYANATAEFEFIVSPIDVIVTVASEPVTYPNTGSVSLNASAPGIYKVKVGDKEYEVTVETAGEPVSVAVTDVFAAGNYDISVTANLDDNYNDVDTGKIGTYAVNRAESTIAVSFADGVFTITLDGVNGEKLNETVSAEIDGTPIDIAAKTENGVFTFTDDNVGPGKHSIFVSFVGNDNYLGDSDFTSFDIPKLSTADVTLTPTKDSYAYLEDVVINITVKDGETNIDGTVVVNVDGIDYAVNITDGFGQATVKGLTNSTYEVNAKFVGNDIYAEADADAVNVVVNASTTAIITASCEAVTYGENSIVNVAVKDGAGNPIDVTRVKVTINGVTNDYTVTDGKIDLGALDANTYPVIIAFEDDSHEAASTGLNVIVNPAVSELNVIPGEGNITLVASDAGGNPISGNATVTIDGVNTVKVEINETGTVVYALEDVTPGAHTVDVRFDKDNYISDSKTVVVNVPKGAAALTISTEDTPTFGDDVTITAAFDPEGPTGTITYFVDGSEVGTELEVGQDFVLSGLSAGEHTIVAKYGGDANYNGTESNVLTINVEKATLDITVEDVTVSYPNKGTVNVNANKDGKYNISVNNKDYEVIIVDGTGSFEVTEVLEAGSYDIAWSIEESENYTATNGYAIYDVEKATPEFSIDGDLEIFYGDINTITPYLNDDAEGNISYSINGSAPVELDVDEKFDTAVLDAGTYKVVAKYSGDKNYANATAEFEFIVSPIDVIVTVTSEPVTYPNTGTISLNVSAPGIYKVKVGDKEYEVIVSNVEEPVPVAVTDVFGAGNYDISVTAPAVTNYNEVNTGKIGTYTVTKAQSTIDVSYSDGEFTITLDGVNGEKLSEMVTVEIDGTPIDIAAKTEDGVFTFTDESVGPGRHSIFVIFDGNDNYTGDSDHTSFDVPKFTTATVTVAADPVKETFDAIINITVKDNQTGLTGTVVVTVDEIDYAINVTDGIGQLVIKNLPADTYDINARFVGNDQYEEATGEGQLIVTEYNQVIIVITGADEGALATLIDIDGNRINGKVNVTIGDDEPVEYDVIDGKVNITGLDEGFYNITVDFLGDDEHPPAIQKEEVYVGKKLIPTTMILTLADIIYGQDAEAVVILTATNGTQTQFLTATVNVTIGNQTQTVEVTNGEGSAKFSGLNAGSYVAIASYESDGTYESAYAPYPIKVEPMLTKIVCREMTTTAINTTEDGRIGEYFYWTLVDAKGNPLANKKVSIGFNAKVYNRTTDANGMAKLQINLERDDIYTFAISFLGDENYNASFEVVKIIVKKQTPKLTVASKTYAASAKTKTLSATFMSQAGNPIVNNTIKFTVNGKTYSAKTDANGVAKVNVSLTTKGSYSVDVVSTKTTVYASVTKKITLKLT